MRFATTDISIREGALGSRVLTRRGFWARSRYHPTAVTVLQQDVGLGRRGDCLGLGLEQGWSGCWSGSWIAMRTRDGLWARLVEEAFVEPATGTGRQRAQAEQMSATEKQQKTGLQWR